jgi:hypothetical protein
LNKVQAQLNANLVFEALFSLEEAQKDFPDNPYILNMKGLVYEKLNKTDSSFIYFDAAERAAKRGVAATVPKVNRLGLFAKKGIDEDLPKQTDLNEKSVAYQANYLALANRKRDFIDSVELDVSKMPKLLTYNDFSFIFNATLNKSLDNRDFDSDTITWLGELSENKDFSKSLKYASSYRLNYTGKIKQAYDLIFQLENDNISDAGFYYFLHGLWLIEQQVYDKAAEHFAKAAELKVSNANTYRVIALILDEKLYEAAQLHKKQLEAESISVDLLKNDPLYKFLQGNSSNLPDSFKYLWLKTNGAVQEDEKASILNDLKDSPFKILYNLNEVEAHIVSADYEIAKGLLNEISIPKAETGLHIYKNNLMALLAVLTKDKELGKKVKESDLLQYPFNYKLIWETFEYLQHEENEHLKSAMTSLGHENPYFVPAILLSANYFNEKDNPDKAYEILVEASRINSNNIELQKKYALQALKLNLVSYADETYSKLADMIYDNEWNEFSKQYEELKKEIEEKPW